MSDQNNNNLPAVIATPRFTYVIKTMGCKANIYDSLVIENELRNWGGERVHGSSTKSDLFIMNSCTVTEQADKQALRELNSSKKKNPETKTLITGCMAEVAKDRLLLEKNVDLVVKNSEKSQIQNAVMDLLGLPQASTDAEQVVAQTSNEIFWGQLPTNTAGRTRAFLKIQEGCNDFCTYCIIPYARGKSRSVRMGAVLAEVSRLVDAGVKEVILTGTNIGDWGKDIESTLEDLIETLLVRTALPRLRLTSLDPSEITPRLLELMSGHTRLMPHFHVSLQSAVSRVLRLMKRHYRQEDVIHALNAIYKANDKIFVGMDMIAGFPSETEEEHREGVELLKDLPWTRLHVFPYSPRQGTPALKISGLAPMNVRRDRAAELVSLSNVRLSAQTSEYVGRVVHNVLFEEPEQVGLDYYLGGHTENYFRVMVKVQSAQEAERFSRTVGSVIVTSIAEKASLESCLEGQLLTVG